MSVNCIQLNKTPLHRGPVAMPLWQHVTHLDVGLIYVCLFVVIGCMCFFLFFLRVSNRIAILPLVSM